MKDKLVRAMTTNKEVRALAVSSTGVVKTAREYHQTTPVATAALGRVLSAALMMGSMVKTGEVTSLKINGDGPLGKIVAESNQYGEVRGYVLNPNIEVMTNQHGKLDVARAVGKGQLIVRKRFGLKEPYEGKIPLVSGEIGEDLTYYFTQSEQIPSSVGLGVLINPDHTVRAAGGFFIQLLPDASEDTISQLEKNLDNIDSVSGLIDEGVGPEGFLTKILDGFNYRILAEKDVVFKCNCGEEKIKNIMKGLGKKELQKTLEEQGRVEIRCHFCGQTYSFDEEMVEGVLAEE